MTVERNLANWERIVSVGVGLALVGGAIRRHRVLSPAALTGASLIARGLAGYCPVSQAAGLTSRRDGTREALGGSRGTRLKSSVTIAKPVEDVFGFWNDVSNLPQVIRGLERVERVSPGLTRWTLRGPGGVRLQWDAEIINEVPLELIAWRSLPGADVVSAGSVHFKSLGLRGTEVTVSMQYAPPGGALGTAAGWIAGWAPASALREDLRRLKHLLETGEQPTSRGQTSGTRTRLFAMAKAVWA